MTHPNLLVELFVEELPPKALQKLGDAFGAVLLEQLQAQGLAAAHAQLTAYASPRRLAAHITEVAPQAADKAVSQKLMPVAVGLDASPASIWSSRMPRCWPTACRPPCTRPWPSCRSPR